MTFLHVTFCVSSSSGSKAKKKTGRWAVNLIKEMISEYFSLVSGGDEKPETAMFLER